MASADYVNKTVAWVKGLYEHSTDNHSGESLLTNLTDDASINFNNHSGVQGKSDLDKLIKWQFDAANKVNYHVEDVTVTKDKIFIATTQNYGLKSGKDHALKVLTVLHKTPEQSKATRADIYADTHEVFDHIKGHHKGRHAFE